MQTSDVVNQVPDFAGHDLFTTDAVAVEAMKRWGDPADVAGLTELGVLAGSPEVQAWADDAHRDTPRLRTHDRTGRRVDEVDYARSYHDLMRVAAGHGLTAEPWTRPPASGAHLRRAVGFVTWSRAEAGHLCPVSMTYAAAPALRSTPALADRWVPLLASRDYDPVLRPRADRRSAIAGMGMTEKQGGSDVRANVTRAVPVPGGPVEGGETYRLTGHKWFFSAPMSDVFLVLATTLAGVTCFLVPRVLDDGTRNGLRLQRLKDKLGNRSNASSEVELDEAWAVRVGDEGRGIRTIIDMVSSTRLDCVLGSTATMRESVVRAVHHARHRSAFGALLVEQPLMRNVLADLALEVEAAELLGLRMAHAVDAGEGELARIGVALGKFWVCKRTPPVVAEALECLGGAGYVEENGLARLYREAPLNSIWEGSGNVGALDVLRAMTREPATVAALDKELSAARGHDRRLDRAIDEVPALVAAASSEDGAWRARRIVEHLAVTLQAALLTQHSPASVSEAFVASRLEPGGHGATFGSLDDVGADEVTSILDRTFT
ncbi:acyl-CoA dehydrogenase [Knoellia flava TL1]|uniref:DNA alkylation response protein n=2 Tax=Knoellia flava TaxID=913969 RepID=A0A8H9KS98_9MICO|nr:acyl-CoA dehydrogenase family protein [Knoellia flava]KGN30474.1 acyl-CoA dehydrogenase [Knoellia flava TL1]GGB65224.1 DNA alkylation response protein [Knoellia flava]